MPLPSSIFWRALIIFLATLSCSDALFQKNPDFSKKTSNSMGDPNAECPASQDHVRITFPLPEARNCVDKNHLYFFGPGGSIGKCTEINTNLDCSFSVIANSVEAFGYSGDSIRKAKTKGAKLVACGQENKGKLIAAQWVYLDGVKSDGCNYSFGNILGVSTVCYRQFVGSPPTNSESPEEENQRVGDCLTLP